MVKKALCVGCNYPSKAFGLAGAVNDAFLVADCLQKNCGFESDNICVLHDVYPGQKKTMKVDPAKTPTRVNILQRLHWLVRNAKPGDILFFSFSGYGLQVDDMDGYEGDGYDEAILPTDFVEGRDGDMAVIVTDDIHDILMGIPPQAHCMVIMDCDHATSVIDVSGTLDEKLVRGLKFQTFCGLSAHTTKVELAVHNKDVWQEAKARAVKARPRFQPVMQIDNPRKGRLPTRPGMSRATPVAFCYSASGHGQTAMEMQMTKVVDGEEVKTQHGILTWCFVQALQAQKYDASHIELLEAIQREMQSIRARELPKMDQEVLLTFSTPLSDPHYMRVMQPLPKLPIAMPAAVAAAWGPTPNRAGGMDRGSGMERGMGPSREAMDRGMEPSETSMLSVPPSVPPENPGPQGRGPVRPPPSAQLPAATPGQLPGETGAPGFAPPPPQAPVGVTPQAYSDGNPGVVKSPSAPRTASTHSNGTSAGDFTLGVNPPSASTLGGAPRSVTVNSASSRTPASSPAKESQTDSVTKDEAAGPSEEDNRSGSQQGAQQWFPNMFNLGGYGLSAPSLTHQSGFPPQSHSWSGAPPYPSQHHATQWVAAPQEPYVIQRGAATQMPQYGMQPPRTHSSFGVQPSTGGQMPQYRMQPPTR